MASPVNRKTKVCGSCKYLGVLELNKEFCDFCSYKLSPNFGKRVADANHAMACVCWKMDTNLSDLFPEDGLLV